MSEITTQKISPQVTDDIDKIAKVIEGNKKRNPFSDQKVMDISNPEECQRLLTLRADIYKQINKAKKNLEEQKELLKKWNEKVASFKCDLKVFTFRKFEYATSGYPFDTDDEMRIVFAALSRAEQWGNREYKQKLKELAVLEKKRDLFKENVLVLEYNIDVLKGTHTELDNKLKSKKKDAGVQQ